MTSDTSRNSEALLAGAGYPPPSPAESTGDFQLDRSSNDSWRITAMSERARQWIKREFCGPLRQCLNDSFVVDMLSADRFLKQAHAMGFRTEYIGPHGKDLY